MLNYEIDPAVLSALLPAGVELDDWQGKTLVSMVGFMVLRTRVLGLPIPAHRNFEEVNLRFYVRRRVGQEWRRGVVFVKEIVPRPWIAQIARRLYQENYVSMPMRHVIENRPKQAETESAHPWLVEYIWKSRAHWYNLSSHVNRMGALALSPRDEPQEVAAGSEEAFISEHYWGYTRLSATRTGEYRVEHPTWRVWTVAQPYLLCDVRSMYGEAFAAALNHRPHSAFLAEGSNVQVNWRRTFNVPAPEEDA